MAKNDRSGAKAGAGAISPHGDYLRDLKRLDKIAPTDDAMTPAIARLEPSQVFEIERMAAQGLNLDTIATRLGYVLDTWYAIVSVNPEVEQAYRAGAARGADWVSSAALANARAGDTSMQKYYLDRFGGPQFRPAQHGPAVIVTTGPLVQIDQDAMARRFERQRLLLDGVIDVDATEA